MKDLATAVMFRFHKIASVGKMSILHHVEAKGESAGKSVERLWIAASTNAKGDVMKDLVHHAQETLKG